MIFIKKFSDLKIRNKLLLSYSAVFILIGALASTTIYHFVRRAIESNIESELQKSTAAILDMVGNAADVSIKNYLRAVAEKNRDIAYNYYTKFKRGEMSEVQAKATARKVMLSQPIGKTGYVYCLTSEGIIDNHPYEDLMGADLSRHKFIQEQKLHKVGYIEYDWQNPTETSPRAKALYMTYFIPWDWIISASSYRSEFQELINVEDFRDIIMSLKFGRTGYSYVIDTNGMLILHPKLEGINILNDTDAEGQAFVRDMIEQRTGKITYSWRNPGESRRRKKLVIFNHIPEYNWIVASSSYLDEFYAPLKTIRLIFNVTLLVSLLLVLPLTLWISASITNPLRDLMERLAQGDKGDVSVRMSPLSKDEVGTLARYFNSFLERLDRSRQSLQAEVEVRRQAESVIRQSEAKYRELVQNANSIILRVDTRGRITFFNEFAQSFFGYDEDEILGQDSFATITPEFDSAGRNTRALMTQAATDPESHGYYEVEHIRRNRERVWVAWTNKAVRSENGEIIEYLCIGHDITEAKAAEKEMARMERMMVQTEKMMSLGGLAAGMAHEINNPLGVMVQNAQNILRRISTDLPANIDAASRCGIELAGLQRYLEQRQIVEFLEGIRAAGDKAAEIVENMLNFSRKSESHKEMVDLAELLDKTIALAAHDYDMKKKHDFRSIHIERHFQPDVGSVPCVATEIEQVVLNLLRNAAQAMAQQTDTDTHPCIKLCLRRQEALAVIDIKDNGPGMDYKTLKRVFEPFFTTKGVGKGTGLGLSVSYFIVTSNHGGTIEANSEPGHGSQFTIRLPMTPTPDSGVMDVRAGAAT